MTGYVETVLTITPPDKDVADLLAAFLAESGYETFQDCDEGIKGYIKESLYSDAFVESAIEALPIKTSSVSYTNKHIPFEDWNRTWIEESFSPVAVGDDCLIHSPGYKPDKKVGYDIEISPVMSFGSGHHQTTYMMAEYLLDEFNPGETFLDMGCGTGVLAILASKLGAESVTAIDIDEIAFENCKDNILLNSAVNIETLLGDSAAINGRHFDVIAANINRNILLSDMPEYAGALNPGGRLYLSGFFLEDTEILKNRAAENGLVFETCKTKGEWASLKFLKP